MDFRSLFLFALVCTSSTAAACTERDPLDSATMAATGDSTGAPPSDPPSDPVTSTGDAPTPTTAVEPGDPTTTTGSVPGDPTETSDSTTGDVPVLVGEYLFAVSTVLAPAQPFQFIATNELVGAPGQQTMRTALQPLRLDQGKVTTPRTPIGEPLVFAGIPVVDGIFKVDLGVVMISGAANPITGSEITAQLALVGEFVGPDFYCGTVAGELMSPVMANLDGSTFAAVRIDDPSDLPLDVTLDCSGNTVTDP
ncbi:hypothetical protein [Nannocystis pusilla]|uniref:hypothetical protein n=1 Tax=Nannocystis pusilla TaxID=889268 RepID=UPI003B780A9F